MARLPLLPEEQTKHPGPLLYDKRFMVARMTCSPGCMLGVLAPKPRLDSGRSPRPLRATAHPRSPAWHRRVRAHRARSRALARTSSFPLHRARALSAHHGITAANMSWTSSSWYSNDWASGSWSGYRSSNSYSDRYAPNSKEEDTESIANARVQLKKAQYELNQQRHAKGTYAKEAPNRLVSEIRELRAQINERSDPAQRLEKYRKRSATIDRLTAEAEGVISRNQEKLYSCLRRRSGLLTLSTRFNPTCPRHRSPPSLPVHLSFFHGTFLQRSLQIPAFLRISETGYPVPRARRSPMSRVVWLLLQGSSLRKAPALPARFLFCRSVHLWTPGRTAATLGLSPTAKAVDLGDPRVGNPTVQGLVRNI